MSEKVVVLYPVEGFYGAPESPDSAAVVPFGALVDKFTGTFKSAPFSAQNIEYGSDADRYAKYAAAWRNRYGFYGAPPSYDEWVSIGKPTGIVETVPPELPALPPRTTTVTVSMPERGYYDKRPATTIPGALPASGTTTVSSAPKQVVQRPIYGSPEPVRTPVQRSAPRVYDMTPAFQTAPVPSTPSAPAVSAPVSAPAVVNEVTKTVTEVRA